MRLTFGVESIFGVSTFTATSVPRYICSYLAC